jgi:demethylmenaquinone methyltransferase/2-methoxy-6-polyprenyl-1,4-benzoquinol methylase
MHPVNTAKAAHAKAVREMFSGIAVRYDLLNHLLSLNIDKRWRKIVAGQMRDILDRPDALVLDVACGTGDLTLELRRGAKAVIIGTDFCRPMLAVAQQKESEAYIPYIEADALCLPFGDGTFDALSIAFGLRNLADVQAGLAELLRLLKPGGRLFILEFSDPVVPGFRQLFNLYFSRILPFIGGVVSGSRGAYEYLPDSVSKFPAQRELASMMGSVGFENVGFRNLTGGIAALHSGTKK